MPTRRSCVFFLGECGAVFDVDAGEGGFRGGPLGREREERARQTLQLHDAGRRLDDDIRGIGVGDEDWVAWTRVWARDVAFVDEAGSGEHLASAHEAGLAEDEVGGQQLVVDEHGGRGGVGRGRRR